MTTISNHLKQLNPPYFAAMKRSVLLFFLLSLCLAAYAQPLNVRQSLFQNTFDYLPLNPGWSSISEATGFQATYLGSFTNTRIVSKSGQVSLYGRSAKAGWGGVLHFFQANYYGELKIRPSYARLFETSLGTFAFGGAVGLSYFDFSDETFFWYYPNFGSVDASVGVHFFRENWFAGVSSLSFFETSLLAKDESKELFFLREQPNNLYAGTVFRINDYLRAKPVALFSFTNLRPLHESGQPLENVSEYFWSIDFQANVIIEDSYMVGLLYGITRYDLGDEFNRYGLSASLLFGNFRLTYGIQQNGRNASGVGLPVSHLVSAGYDFPIGEEETPVRFF
ncbi:MAG: hypothetical protein AAB316_18520 [Bacteroidota bacterium]